MNLSQDKTMTPEGRRFSLQFQLDGLRKQVAYDKHLFQQHVGSAPIAVMQELREAINGKVERILDLEKALKELNPKH